VQRTAGGRRRNVVGMFACSRRFQCCCQRNLLVVIGKMSLTPVKKGTASANEDSGGGTIYSHQRSLPKLVFRAITTTSNKNIDVLLSWEDQLKINVAKCW
jgi:hypothetical protein